MTLPSFLIVVVVIVACAAPQPMPDAATAQPIGAGPASAFLSPAPEPKSSCGTLCILNTDCQHDILQRCRFCNLGKCAEVLIADPVEP